MYKLFFVCVSFFCSCAFCQSPTAIGSYALAVTFQKTTNIIFPYRVEKADIGSPDVIGRHDAGLGNVLFLKANRKNFAPTNLSVYTSDGKFYSFIIRYAEDPDTLNISFAGDQKIDIQIREPANDVIDHRNEALLDSDAARIPDQRGFLHKITASGKMRAVLTGIYIRDQVIWFKIELKNHSPIDYNREFTKFYIRDRSVSKRTAIQETELKPLWRSPDKAVSAHDIATGVFGLPAFTLAHRKMLVIQCSEKNGGRLLEFDIRPKSLLRCQPF